MCGICGVVPFNKQSIEKSKEQVNSMMAKMHHRGPDDNGVFSTEFAAFGFVRLSILDLSQAGHQPMQSPDNRYTIVFNGEIYNYIEIRKELESDGFKFKSNTDTEVLLSAYVKWGEACLTKLNGMFAFAVYDKSDGSVLIARDRYGIKPLYYYESKDGILFASEIPSILEANKNIDKSVDNQAIFDYLVFNRTDQSTNTFFRNIKKLQHGHILKIENGKKSIKPWYTLKDNLNNPFNSSDEYRSMFSSSLSLRLRSDVPIGVCLSGGLDSSSIVSVLLQDFNKKDLNTFSAVYGKGYKGDESEYISEFSKDLSNMYYTTPTGETLYNDMHDFVRAHGEPVPSTSPYAQFKVMELAQKHVVVTLDGQGADEALGGYHYFFGNYYKELLREFRLLNLITECFKYYKLHRSLYAYKTLAFFLLPEGLKTKARLSEKGYLNPSFSNNYSVDNIIAAKLYDSPDLQSALLNHFEYKLEHLLKWEDRNSMWFSLESRVPFLDYRLVEGTLAMPSNKIINQGITKQILRNAMKGVLPEKIRTRQDKIGFGTPEDEWFRSSFFIDFVNDLINSEKFKSRGIIDHTSAQRLFNDHISRKKNISKEIWKWINLELWFREFIDK